MKRLILFVFIFFSLNANTKTIVTFISSPDINTIKTTLIETKTTNKINISSENNLPKKNISENDKTEHFNKLVNLLSISLVAILSLLSLSLYKNNTIEFKSHNLLKEKNKELEREKEKSEKAIKAKSDFLATISHELRTPLNAINIISEILINEEPKESQMENLISLKISTGHLMNLINDVLQINKIESPNLITEEIEFNLRKKIINIDKSLYEIAKLNNVTCKIIIDDKIPRKVIGDPTKLTQILINLISNAIKFSSNGTVTTNLKISKITDQEVTIKFEIIDNGMGISKDKQELIFENFTQGSTEINRKFGGTGLGLTIVKKLLEHLGSSINLNSEENIGSNFNFELAFKIAKDEFEPIYEIDYSILENKNFLLVEDNNITQIVTRKLIEKHNAYCTVASNGKEALKLSNQNNYDIIIMDINLPDINGDKISEKIREFNTTTPIIAFTAISIEGEECFKNLKSKGMNDYISKPTDIKLFYKTIIKQLTANN
ncbi:ATP-binding protein [uncultured Flavobacterium sp.]|uniref:ATP-binding protein n=1 Tax=uncultured Flavobacterium sp. TaxID=165435 RepID=UPI0030EC7334|tara:strand:- start:1995 stop:3473 length:1479 start_codon:yes stop_codon:yes gene_type:complete